MEYLIAAYTDTGIQKETNQDSICVRRAAITDACEIIMAIVCDGMGGLKKGEVASAASVNAFGAWFDKNLNSLPMLCGTDFSLIRRQWSALIEELHQNLQQYAARSGVQMGTTITAFFACADQYLTMNIGDSRIYERKNKNVLFQLTQDQSLVAREIAAGRITEEESRHHPQRNILLQCLGAGDHVTPVFTTGKIRNDALYLLCSDGLVHEMSSEELAEHLQSVYLNSKDSMTAALREATELCKSRGETDNITSVLIKTQEGDCTNPKKFRLNRLRQALHLAKANREQTVTLLETAQITHTEETIEIQ